MANIVKNADLRKKERLIASKKTWNKTVKLLIAKLIAFKRALNGTGDKDANLPKVNIKDPFPVEFNTYLSSIVDDYGKVVSGANFVIDLQRDFSATRRKSRKELREISASISDYENVLTSEASWWGSQAWAWFALFRLGKDQRNTRLKMLNFVKKSIGYLNDIEFNLTSTSAGSDVVAILGLAGFINLFIGSYGPQLDFLVSLDKKALPDNLTDEPKLLDKDSNKEKQEDFFEEGEEVVRGKPPEPDLTIEQIELDTLAGLQARISKIDNSQSVDTNVKKQISSEYIRLRGLLAKKKDIHLSEIVDAYKNLNKIISKAEENLNSSANSEEEELKKLAQKALRRWLNRKLLEWNPSNSDTLKLQIVDEIKDTSNKLKELMDYLESLDRSTADIVSKSSEIFTLFKSIIELTITFADDYRLKWRMESNPKKRPAKLDEDVSTKLRRLYKVLPKFIQ